MTDTYSTRLDDFNSSMAKFDGIITELTTKSADIDAKIAMLVGKTTLQLEESTHFLKFQNVVIRNEIAYLSALKNMINTAAHNQFFDISENITMVAVSYLNIYKDISGKTINLDIKPDTKVKMSCKKFHLSKIITDISANITFISDLLNDLKIHNNSLTGELTSGNFHCATLNNDLENKYHVIELEYLKFTTALDKNIAYFTDFAGIITDHASNPKLRAFCIWGDRG